MKPKILHVIDHTEVGGAQVVVYQLMRMLQEKFSFAVAVLGSSGEFSARYQSLRIPVFELGNQRIGWDLIAFQKLIKVIHSEQVDLIHTHLFKSNILGSFAAKLTGCKTILHDHTGVYPESLKYCSHYFPNSLFQNLYLLAFRYTLKQVDQVIVLTPKTLRSYQEFYSLDPGKISIVPNGVEPREYSQLNDNKDTGLLRQELGLSAETRIVMMAGRLEPEKDWVTFLKVASQLQKKYRNSCAYLVVGSGKDEHRLRAFADTNGLEQINFLGYRTDIPELLSQADVFLLTSRLEPFGIVILEAMASGCPVVATQSIGPISIITPGVDGLLAEKGDIDGLADQVALLLEDESMRCRLAQQARHTVVKHYSLDIVTEMIRRIYTKVLEA